MAKIKYVPASHLLLHDRRMLQLMVFVVDNKMKGVTGEVEFLNTVGGPNKANVSSALKNGTQHFTIADIKRACDIFGVDANFFFLEKHTTMIYPKNKTTPFEMLLVAVQAVGTEMGAFTPLEKEETEAQKLRRSVDMIKKEEKRKEVEAKERQKIVETEEKRKKANFDWI